MQDNRRLGMSSTFNLRPWQKVSGDHGGTRTDQCKNDIGVRIHLNFAVLWGRGVGGGKCLEKFRKTCLSVKVSLDQPLWRVDSPCSAKS